MGEEAMPNRAAITEHAVKTSRHTTFFLSCGRADAPPVILLHGWPELSISWRGQLPVLAGLGFRAIAPDMRGYGRSSVHPRHEDYALQEIVADMIELADALGLEKAVWVGHDWGSPVVWELARHHPERCHGVASLCVPYFPDGFVLERISAYIDRTIYLEADYPAGQWDYMHFYEANFERAHRVFEADVAATIRTIFRKGNPSLMETPSRTSMIRRDNGWFGGADRAPPAVPLDTDIVSPEDFTIYVAALQRNGFFGPDSWYMNQRRNADYARSARDGGRLTMPVLFLHAAYDQICETVNSRLADPMRAACANLTEAVVPSGHWMAQEKPDAVNSAIARWLAAQFPGLWSPPLKVG
jgi:pimeloyl-ACP methyl ester carboxylesterase